MKNLKRALSLVLSAAMMVGMMVVGTSAHTDVTAEHNEEAIAVVTLAGIMGANEEFNPDANITRNEMAVVMTNMLGLDTADFAGASKFTDVPAWAADYVDACYANGIVSGVSATEYNGSANVTTAEAALMVMKALGYFQYAADFENDWLLATIKQASKIDLLDGVDAKANAKLTRNEVAQLCFNALNLKVVSNITSTLAVNEAGQLHNVYNYTANGDLLREDLYGKTATDSLDYVETTNELGQKVIVWTLKEKNEKDATVSVLKAAELVYVNATKADAIEKDLKAADLAEGNEAAEAAVIAAETANGKTVYVYDDLQYAVVEKKLETVNAIGKDKVSTPDEDERYIQIGTKYIVADEDVTAGVEVDNFDGMYKALKKDDKVVVVFDVYGEIYSVEIPETITAKVTRAKGDEFVAGGETFKLVAGVSATVAKEQKIIALDGVAYSVENVKSEASKVIYVDTMMETTKDKFGNATYTAQIITEDFAIEEMVVDQTYTQGYYTYKWDSDKEYNKLTAATASEITENATVKLDKKSLKLADGKYFASDVQFVYIEKTGKDLAVTVKTGSQVVDGVVDYVYDTDAKEVTIVYVNGAYDDGITDDVVFVADASKSANVIDNEGKAATEYTVYVDGVEESWMLKNAQNGFFTYALNSKNGVYELKAQKGYTVDVVKDTTITKDKYVNAVVGGVTIADATVAEIYDLTDEGLTTLALINGWDGKALEISFMYDKDDNVITAMYVEFK